jgi:hypothetical protein
MAKVGVKGKVKQVRIHKSEIEKFVDIGKLRQEGRVKDLYYCMDYHYYEVTE